MMMRESERSAVRQEIDLLREQGARRQALSLHACSRLFFDYGIKPSVVSVRELTSMGSAGDIPRDIEVFWQQVRQASRLRAGQGAIPEALEGTAGELLGALYQSALDNARKGLGVERDVLAEQVQEAEQHAHDAELKLALLLESGRQVQLRLDEEVARRERVETELAVLRGETAAYSESHHSNRGHWQAELEGLRRQLADREVAYAALQKQADTLRTQAQLNAENYASQLKDAMDDAQRRVRPMLVELDGLRTLASTYQAGVKESSRREFDFMQQLSTLKGRADTLEKLANRQADELAGLHRELATRERSGVEPAVAQVLVELAVRGVLGATELAQLGRSIDALVPIPKGCPGCADGEPELADLGGRIEIACPECGRSSGWCQSRLAASQKFNAGV